MTSYYRTEAFVFKKEDKFEADRNFSVFTKDFGMIQAQAQGVRKISSKLRYSLQNFSYAEIDLVQGKEVWRITNAKKKPLLDQVITNYKVMKITNNIFNLLKRLCHGEEKNESLFEDILRGFFLLSNPKITIDEVNNTEFVLVLRILHRLGYWGEIDGMASLTTSPFNYLLLNEVQPLRKKIISEINKSLKATQL